jgi:hypothetical protein
MSYILIDESLFRSLMGRILNQLTDVSYRFSETDYWVTGKEVCELLNISQGMLSAYRKNNLLFYCRIKETYRYKRAEVYKLKAEMDRELVESGAMLDGCKIINSEAEAIQIFEKE